MKSLFKRKAEFWVLQGEGFAQILDPTEDQVREKVLSLMYPANSFLALTDRDGNYMQVMGSRPWCAIERGSIDPEDHRRAFQQTPEPKFLDGTNLNYGAGRYPMMHDEWFLRKDAADILAAYFNGEPLPPVAQWRKVSAASRQGSNAQSGTSNYAG